MARHVALSLLPTTLFCFLCAIMIPPVSAAQSYETLQLLEEKGSRSPAAAYAVGLQHVPPPLALLPAGVVVVVATSASKAEKFAADTLARNLQLQLVGAATAGAPQIAVGVGAASAVGIVLR